MPRRGSKRRKRPQQRLVRDLDQVVEGLVVPVAAAGGAGGEVAVAGDEAVERLGVTPVGVGDVVGPLRQVDGRPGAHRPHPRAGDGVAGHRDEGERPVAGGVEGGERSGTATRADDGVPPARWG